MKYDGSLFAKTVNDEHGTLVAGIAGWTWAGICEITELWVDENCELFIAGCGLVLGSILVLDGAELLCLFEV